MLPELSQLLSKHVWRWLRPTKLIEAVLGSNRLTLSDVYTIDNINSTAAAVSTFTGTTAIPTSNIMPNAFTAASAVIADPGNMPAGAQRAQISDLLYTEYTDDTPDSVLFSEWKEDQTSDSIIFEDYSEANVSHDMSWKFFVKGLPETVVTIGRAPDSEQASVGTEFIPTTGGHLFSVDPEKYGTAVSTPDGAVLHFFVSGTGCGVNHQPFLYGAGKLLCNDWDLKAYAEARRYQSRGIGCGAVLAAAAGDSVCSTDSRIETVWSEGDVTYAHTSEGELLQTRALSHKAEGFEIKAGDVLADNSECFVFTLRHPVTVDSESYNEYLQCWLSTEYKETDVSDYKDCLKETYPEVFVDTNAAYTEQLKRVIEEAGYSTTVIDKSPLSANGHHWVAKTVSFPTSCSVVDLLTVSMPFDTESDTTLKAGVAVNTDPQRLSVYLVTGSALSGNVQYIPGMSRNTFVYNNSAKAQSIWSTSAVFKVVEDSHTTLHAVLHSGCPAVGGLVEPGNYVYAVALGLGEDITACLQLAQPVVIKVGKKILIKIKNASGQ